MKKLTVNEQVFAYRNKIIFDILKSAFKGTNKRPMRRLELQTILENLANAMLVNVGENYNNHNIDDPYIDADVLIGDLQCLSIDALNELHGEKNKFGVEIFLKGQTYVADKKRNKKVL